MKIAVIGAGVVGVSTALELASQGHQVVVYEKGNGIAQQASFATGGFMGAGLVNTWTYPGAVSHHLKSWLTNQSAIHINEPTKLPFSWLWQWARACQNSQVHLQFSSLQRLAFYSQETFKSITEKFGLSYESSQGTLLICRDEDDFKSVERQLSSLKEVGIAFKNLSADEARHIEPALSAETKLAGAVFFPNDKVANCRQFTLLAKQEAEQLGVIFKSGVEVLPLSKSQPLNIQISGSPDEIYEHVVVCAGIQSKKLVSKLGIHLPIEAIYGYTLSAALREEMDSPTFGVCDAKHQVGITRSGQRIRVSGVFEFGSSEKSNNANTKLLFKVLNDWFPGSARIHENVQLWRACRDVVCDGVPIIGLSGVPGVWLNTGHGNHGWACSSGSARAIADMVSSRECEIDLKGLGIERF